MNTHICTYAHVHARAHTYVHAHMHTHIYTHLYIYTFKTEIISKHNHVIRIFEGFYFICFSGKQLLKLMYSGF